MSPTARWLLRGAMALGLAFIYVPLAIVLINSFNADRTFAWPPSSLDHGMVGPGVGKPGCPKRPVDLGEGGARRDRHRARAGHDGVLRGRSVPVLRPGIHLAADRPAARAARHRHRHRPGLAPSGRSSARLGIGKGLFSVIVGHATFCVVVVYNNVLARLRRLGGNFEEASADLGAHTFQTFRYVTFPLIRSALFAGGLLAFALSFDEIIVTTFTAGAQVQTLPIWIFANLFRPNQAPIINVVAAVLIVLSIIPIYIAQRISSDSAAGGRL